MHFFFVFDLTFCIYKIFRQMIVKIFKKNRQKKNCLPTMSESSNVFT